jgi:tetratricopeptide (TPR) repeat protein
MGNIYSEQDNYTRAIRNYEKAIKLDPGQAVVHNNMGGAYRKQGNYSKAIQCIEKAINLGDYLSFVYYIGLGEVYKEKGDYAKAIQSFDKAIELDPDDDNITKELIDELIADMTGK